MDLALNNLQRLICHKLNNQPTNLGVNVPTLRTIMNPGLPLYPLS